jgi:hypothetical protein
MKKLILIIFSVLILFNSSCLPDKCCVPPKPPTITAQKNGEAWQLRISKSTVSDVNRISISTIGQSVFLNATDSLSISLAYTGIGNYKVTDNEVSYIVFSNGAQIKYVLDTTFDNSININQFNVLRNPATTNPDPTELKATFNLKFIDPAHTTSVSLLNGKFTAYVVNSN